MAVLTESVDTTSCCRKLKQRPKAESHETVTSCHGLKMKATNGKLHTIDVPDIAHLLRIVRSIPSKKVVRPQKAKQWRLLVKQNPYEISQLNRPKRIEHLKPQRLKVRHIPRRHGQPVHFRGGGNHGVFVERV